jgi:DNA-binding IclR family transcriptional regulator
MNEFANTILETIRNSSEPVGRSVILRESGIPEAKWLTAITQLKTAGLVVQQGTRRGAKYVASEGNADPMQQIEAAIEEVVNDLSLDL